jgi:ABC-2 type transport system ATP-binding protein
MVDLNCLHFGYRRNRPVLEGIDLAIKPGIIYGLLGKNGEGKTTLLHIMGGLLFPDSGSCRVMGDEPAARRADFLQKVFLLPEEIVLPDVAARTYIGMYAPFYPTFNRVILRACVEWFEIDLGASLRKMSQGQRKKVAIALALSVHTPLLLMDEPTNGLDIPSKSIFRKLLALFMEENQTLIISTHQVRDLESLIDAVVIIDNKKVVMNRTLDEVAARLDFRVVGEGEAAIYAETSPAGRMGVVANTTGERSCVSLELLFNAAVMATGEVKKVFNS